MGLKRHIYCVLLLLALLPVGSSAEKIAEPQTIFGTRFYSVQGQDGVPRIYVFADLSDAMMQASGLAQWYEYPNLTTPIGNHTSVFADLQDGSTYMVEMGGKRDTFVVFDYRNYRIANKEFKVECSCEETLLKLDAEPMRYYTLTGQVKELNRTFLVRYTNLIRDSIFWKENEYEDSVRTTRPREIKLPKLLMNTTIDVMGDEYAELFYDEPDLVRVEESDVHAIAIDFIPKSYTALRGEHPENENMRVVDEKILTGSAPLNVLFQSNATPLTEFFYWEIKRSDNVLSSRTESDTRYIFNESGKYSVKLTISNSAGCTMDTTFQVDAKESMLLVPNVFTPNGDGSNDEFRVVYRSLASFSIAIFNRWQHQVYSSSDPAKGWNGRINGRIAPDGAYYYVIEAKGTDGKKYKLSGAVNLLTGGK